MNILELEKSLFIFIHQFNFQWLNPVMIFLSGKIIWVPFILLFIILGFRHHRKYYFWWFGGLILGLILSDITSSYVLKNFFQRPRPCKIEDLNSIMNLFGQKCGGRFGFISSHAANSMLIISYAFMTLPRIKFKIFFFLFPLLIGWSRIYLGAHFVGDVVFGYLVGLICSYLIYWCLKHLRGQAINLPRHFF